MNPFRSIRWRFAFWLAFLLTIVLAGFGFTAYQLHRNNQFAQLDEELKQRAAVVAAVLRTPPLMMDRGPRNFGPGDRFGGPPRRFGPEDAPEKSDEFTGDNNLAQQKFSRSAEISRLFSETSTNGYYYVAWTRIFGAREYSQSTNAPVAIPQPERRGFDVGTYPRNRDIYREVYQFTERGDCILIGKSVLAERQATQHFALWLAVGGLIVLLLGVGGIWFIAGRALRPVQEIGVTATRISAGNLTERINAATTEDELGELAATLNSTFARLETAFKKQQQFTADASHELRTPLTVMISEAQTTLARPRTEAEYRETVETCLQTAQQMRQLTDALLQLARLDAGQEWLQSRPIDLATLTRSAVEQLRPLAAAQKIQIHDVLQPAPTHGDADLLLRVVTNLILNAIQHSRPEGTIQLTTQTNPTGAQLEVHDTGVGISAEDLPHIFDRFYRADKARSRSDGHSGLGLAICQAIITAHGGKISVTSQPDKGSIFTLCLPTSPATAPSTN